eukprot:tig00001086_g6871.t1
MAQLDDLIQLVNRLQDVLSQVGMAPNELIDLPQIAVVGGQSSGKSSVLENFVGRDFLPRGSGLVTRRPCILQMFQTAQGTQEYAEFQHRPGQQYTNWDAVREEIIADTDRICGHGQVISPNPITLRVYSPHVVNLTLIDLPGLTKVPVGDQPVNIDQIIRDMVLSFITRPNSIILAVTAANTDLANSDALQLARAVDPDGNRTVGVITKLDLMDKGTDASDILTGRVIPLKRGYIGVVNRSQQDINSRKSIQASKDAERAFFMSHPVYKDLTHTLGTELLAKKLSRMLGEHIKNTLPEIKRKVNDMQQEYKTQLEALGEGPNTPAEQGAILLQCLSAYAEDFRDALDGTMLDIPIDELYGGARIMYVFNDIFASTVRRLDALEGLTDIQIRTCIRNVMGATSAPLFVPEEPFIQISQKQVRLLEQPSQECVDLVYNELRRLLMSIDSPELDRFPNLKMRVTQIANELLRESQTPTKDVVDDLINIELGFVNTDHPDFSMAKDSVRDKFHSLVDTMAEEAKRLERDISPNPRRADKDKDDWKFWEKDKKGKEPPRLSGRTQQRPQRADDDDEHVLPNVPTKLTLLDDATKKEQIELEMTRMLLETYFNIVRSNIIDGVPKAIMCFMVNKVKDLLEQRLISTLFKDTMFGDLLQEEGTIGEQRKRLAKSVELLTRAKKVLDDVAQA